MPAIEKRFPQVYRCGECDLSIQGKVSIVQHLLTHEAASPTSPAPNSMELATGKPPPPGNAPSSPTPLVNGESHHELNGDDSGMEKQPLSPAPQEQIQVEINPLELLSTILEEDMRSENPVLPTQHFLLGHPAESGAASPSELYPGSGYDDYPSGGEFSSSSELYTTAKEEPEPLSVNGLALSQESSAFYESAAPGVFQCGQCSEAFKYQYLLTAHRKQRHEGSVVTPFRCRVCGNEFTALSDLKRHATAAGHATDLSHFCPVCGHAFAIASDLKQHLADHSKNNRRPPLVLGQLQTREGVIQSA